ncbi:MAG: cytochrome b N-terminal domain-containing protein, partial [Planctomycetota bacterium]
MNTPANSTGQGADAKCRAVCQGLKRLACRSIDWIDDRIGFRSAVDWLAGGTVPRGEGWSAVWPSMIVFAFVVQVITGFFLWIFYSPSAQTAWESVYYLEYEVAGGWLLRGVHHYSAQVLVALSAWYVIWLIVSGTYRAPRECVYWVAVLMGLGSLGLCLTGDLLAWDQNSYASTLVRTKFLMLLPVVGDDLFKLAAGGPAFGHLTLTRFFALHIGVFASGFFVLLLLHGWLVRRAAVKEESEGWHALAKRGHVPGKHGDASDAMPPGRTWPSRPVCLAASWLAVMVIVGLLVGRHALWGDHSEEAPAAHLGVGLGAPADPDPANFYAAARPEWSFRGLYQLSHMFPGDEMPLVGMSWKAMPIFQIPGVLLVLILLMPFLGRGRRGHRVNLSMLAGLVGALVVLSAMSWWHDAGNTEHQAALAAGRVEAERVKQLARAPSGIPASGALSLLRNDPKTQGPRLYRKQCAVCHAYSGPQQEAMSSETPSAPDLYGFATRDWLAGFFDPDRITTPQYYGNTKFASGVMARYVEGPFSELEEEEQAAIVAALEAEARLLWQHELDRKDQELIQKGRELISAGECTRCHRFGDHGKLGDAPDLTGYGSPEWIMGIVIDP